MPKRFTMAMLVAVAIIASTCGHAFAGEPTIQEQPQIYGEPQKLPQERSESLEWQPESLTPPPMPKSSWSGWYGWQTLLIEVPALIFIVIGATTEASVAEYIGFGGMVLGPPAVHWAHGNIGKGFIGLGVMLGLPVGVGYLGSAIGGAGENHNTCGDMCGFPSGLGFIGGAVIGAVGAIVINSALAWDRADEKAPPPRMQTHHLEIAPTFAFTQQGAGVGVVGQF